VTRIRSKKLKKTFNIAIEDDVELLTNTESCPIMPTTIYNLYKAKCEDIQRNEDINQLVNFNENINIRSKKRKLRLNGC